MMTQEVDKDYILHLKEQGITTCLVPLYQVYLTRKFSLSSLHSVTTKPSPNPSDVVKNGDVLPGGTAS